jgi:integrase
MKAENALVRAGSNLPAGLQQAIAMWADATTRATSTRRRDLLRDKGRAVGDFFAYTGKSAQMVTPLDVSAWQADLEGRGLAPATVYAMISRVSSFYTWAMAEPALANHIGRNPADLARPKAPAAYQTESTQALSDGEMRAILGAVRERADAGDVVGKRDYALLLLYLATGMRRSEVIGLCWGDIKIDGALTLTGTVKGGDYVSREVADLRVRDALLDYLHTSGRLAEMTPDAPLWTAHDRTGQNNGKPLTGHAFAKRFKRYARRVGLGDVHLHQTRHTFARLVSEETGSMTATQDALGHKNAATTRVYVQRVAVKRDKHSTAILDRLENAV